MTRDDEIIACVWAYVDLDVSPEWNNRNTPLEVRHKIADRMEALVKHAASCGESGSDFWARFFKRRAEILFNPQNARKRIKELQRKQAKLHGHAASRAQATTREARLGHLQQQIDSLQEMLSGEQI